MQVPPTGITRAVITGTHARTTGTVITSLDPVTAELGLEDAMLRFAACDWREQVFDRHLTTLFVLFALGILLFTSNSCSPAARQRIGAAASGAAAGAARSQAQSNKLMIFGGEDHKTYLGCLNCNEYASDSVFNSYGSHGSAYSTESIWNHYSDFGSPYSIHSACNPYASDPPVIVDQNGTYYGRLTVNEYHPQRAAGANYYAWLTETVCK